MRFWDSSAIVPLLVDQPATAGQQALLKADSSMIVWWMSESECFSALARLEREGALNNKGFLEAAARLDALSTNWLVVSAIEAVKQEVRRILRVHPLRCADAFQLAAATIASERAPSSLCLVTLDERLALAASKEGFETLS